MADSGDTEQARQTLELALQVTETITDKWGQFVTIKMDDGRDIEHLPICGFSSEYKGHGGTRFVTIDAYNAYRQAMADNYGFDYKKAV